MLNGSGTTLYGKMNVVCTEKDEYEEYDTTKWFVLLFVPIIPLKSYRIRRKKLNYRLDDNICDLFYRKQESVGFTYAQDTYLLLKEYPLNWKQVATTYSKVFLTLIVLYGLVAFLSR